MPNYVLAGRRLLHDRARRRTKTYWYQFVVLVGLLIAWYFTLAPSSLNGPITYAVVSGHSMEPSLYTGDLVMVHRQTEYQVGDTVLTSVLGGLVIHRIVWLSADSVKTQGINNDFVDTWTLSRRAILGKQLVVFKQVGPALFFMRNNPLVFGLVAAALGGLLLIEPRRRHHSKRLEQILASTERELPQVKKTYLNTLLVALYVLAGGALVATGILLANHTKFYPRLLLSLSGVVISILAFEVLGNWLAAGKDLEEPDRSISVFRKRLYRIDPTSQIEGLTRTVSTASELMTFADIAKTPILHLVLQDGTLHQFFVVTDDLNYVFTVNLDHISRKMARHKK